MGDNTINMEQFLGSREPKDIRPLNAQIYETMSNSFVMDISEKQLDRYVSRAAASVMEALKKTGYISFVERHTLEGHVLACISAFYMSHPLMEMELPKGKEGLELKQRCEKYKLPVNQFVYEVRYLHENTSKFLKNEDVDVMIGYNIATGVDERIKASVSDVVWNAAKETFIEWAFMIETEKLEEGIRMTPAMLMNECVPKRESDKLFLFGQIVRKVYIDLQMMAQHSCNESMLRKNHDEVVEEFNKRAEAMRGDFTARETELKNRLALATSKIAYLNSRVESLEAVRTGADAKLQDALSEKDRQIAKLTRELKEAEALAYIDSVDEDEDEEAPEKTVPEFDHGMRIAFAATDNTGFREQILKKFPNALFITADRRTVQTSIDLLVVVTYKMSHAFYNQVMSAYADTNVPLIRVRGTNSSVIEMAIGEYLKNSDKEQQ